MPRAKSGGNESEAIPAAELKSAIESSLGILGPGLLQATMEELVKNGIDLDSNTASYSLNEVSERLETLFGDAASLMVDRIKEQLKFGK